MEEIFRAIVLGIIQGTTEFIPVSSTAHLRIIPALLGWKDIGAAYSAVMQIGTLVATLIYFRNDIINLINGFLGAFKKKDFLTNSESRNFILIILGTIPIGVCGLLFKRFIEGDARGLYVISAALILLAVILFIAEKVGSRKKDLSEITVKDGLIIGFAQALALIPGSSRSGVTITAGLFRGLKRDVAARFSFLLSIPAIGLSGLYELYKERDLLLNENLLSLTVATVVSGIVGYLSIAFLISYLKTKSNMVFIIYRIALGILILILLSQGILSNLE
ncbi:MAG TPA: undecaprenyl-diphosphate phosphatase [Ignavibacteria bacterium]|nr:undecaprenyl-diphosphate phosphatase [Ignavibacteria bacterium]HMR38908.1 undecaprenyl-diphosphate phosphatase [Ignavibacteria bacterium]